ncbi:hypothetical protein ACFE04_008637 [Oxalis oulophora]
MENMNLDMIEPISAAVSEQYEDRLTSLPHHVVHRILFLLDIEDIAKLSLASKKCDNLCLTVPRLKIYDCEGSDVRIQFLDFLVSFIKRRNGTKMSAVSLNWFCERFAHNEMFRIMWLINQVIECQVDYLYLQLFFDNEPFIMPMDVFWSESMRTLTIDMLESELQLPSPHGVSHLKYLRLDNAEIADDSLGEWISSVCKFLEELWLAVISGIKKFRFTSQSLLLLHIESCSFDYLDISTKSLGSFSFEPFETSTIISLNINAPNLFILHCPKICLDYFTVKKSELKYTVRLFLPETCPIRTDEFHSLLASIAQVTKLTTNSSSIQEIPLDNNETSRFDFKFWESLKFSFVDGLEDIDIGIHEGKNEEGLIEFFLGNAKKLKKLIITSNNCIPTKLAHKIESVVAASANRIEFNSRGNRMTVEFKPQLRSLTMED